MWGLFACTVAVWAAELGSLIEVVNRIGSFFYGSVLGVFILAIAFPRATGTGAFVGLIAGMSAVALAAAFTPVAFLWHNVIGAVVVVFVGLAAQFADSTLTHEGCSPRRTFERSIDADVWTFERDHEREARTNPISRVFELRAVSRELRVLRVLRLAAPPVARSPREYAGGRAAR